MYNAGMRRLSINDLAHGDQPLYNEDQSIVLLYNGEIYNYPELRKYLENKGHIFATRSDGEVICHLYEEVGEAVFERLDGMFAAALWVEKEQKLILARDLPGEKPLYYIRLSGNQIAFASEIKALLQFPDWNRSLNMQAIWDFPTFLWVPEPATVYEQIMALPKGHYLVADQKEIRIHSYPNQFGNKELQIDDDNVIEETNRVVSQAIRSRLLSDVPVGCFLSSGLDSSIVATIASQSLSDLTTFTIGFEDVADPYHGQANEAHEAEEYAKKLGTTHYTIHVTADDFRRSLADFCIYGDQPFSVSSGLGILAIAKAARERGVKVLLTGDGADECFGGYSWYEFLPSSKCNNSPTAPLDPPVSFQNFGLPLNDRLTVLNTLTPQERAWAWHYYAAEREKAQLFNKEACDNIQPSLRHFFEFNSSRDWSPEQFIGQDRSFYLPNEMLRKADRMTMAHSVEGRVPFVAPAVMALSDKLKYHQMVRGKTLKWALRKAFSKLLPESVHTRPKHGFNVPIDHWLKGEWSDLLHESFGQDSCLMKMGFIDKNSIDFARNMLNDPQRLNGHTIFSFIMLNMWLEKVHGNHC